MEQSAVAPLPSHSTHSRSIHSALAPAQHPSLLNITAHLWGLSSSSGWGPHSAPPNQPASAPAGKFGQDQDLLVGGQTTALSRVPGASALAAVSPCPQGERSSPSAQPSVPTPLTRPYIRTMEKLP